MLWRFLDTVGFEIHLFSVLSSAARFDSVERCGFAFYLNFVMSGTAASNVTMGLFRYTKL